MRGLHARPHVQSVSRFAWGFARHGSKSSKRSIPISDGETDFELPRNIFAKRESRCAPPGFDAPVPGVQEDTTMTSIPQPRGARQNRRVTVLGVPFDEYSSFARGAAAGPEHIRLALHSGASNLCTESGLDLEHGAGWTDAGDLTFSRNEDPFSRIHSAVQERLAAGTRVLALGGDHSITYPIVKAYARAYPRLAILHLDAHADLYDVFQGNRYSHACPFARIMEEGLAERLVQAGIRTLVPHHREQAKRFGVEIHEMKDWSLPWEWASDIPVYLSLDLDALDPAFVPGVAHPEPGGFTVRDVLAVVQGLKAGVVGADIVELNPALDRSGLSARVAAKFVKEILARMLS
jgi:arginase